MTNALLNKLAKSKATAKKGSKPEQPKVEVSPATLEKFERFAKNKVLVDHLNAHKESVEGDLKADLLNAYTETMFRQGSRPANPNLEVYKNGEVDTTAIFQVHENFRVNVPSDDGRDMSERLTEILTDFVGFNTKEVERFLENEVEVGPDVSLRPFNELSNGTELEQEAATKLMELVLGNKANPLTEKERDAVLVVKEKVTVKEGFLERVKLYVKDENQLKRLLNVFQPKHYLSHVKFAKSDDASTQLVRLHEHCKDVLGFAA